MAKKVLIGVGIGCGVLILLVVVGLGVVGYMAKKKLGGSIEAAQQMEAQQKELNELDKSYPFTPPADGTPVAIQEKRLTEYLAIRESVLPVFQEFERKGDEFQKQHEGNKEADLGAALEGIGMLSGFIAQMRATYIEGLKKHQMSPREFHAITNAIYSSQLTGAMNDMKKATGAELERLNKEREELANQLETAELTDEQRAELEQRQSEIDSQVDMLTQQGAPAEGTAPSGDPAVVDANRALVAKHQERIAKLTNPAFDAFIISDESQNPFGQTPGGGGGGGGSGSGGFDD